MCRHTERLTRSGDRGTAGRGTRLDLLLGCGRLGVDELALLKLKDL